MFFFLVLKQENKASKSNEAEKCDQIATKEEKIDFSNVKIEPLFEEEVEAKKKKREPIMLPRFSCHIFRHTFASRFCENETNEELHLIMVDNHIPAGAKLY